MSANDALSIHGSCAAVFGFRPPAHRIETFAKWRFKRTLQGGMAALQHCEQIAAILRRGVVNPT
jgi:hypothetical protein